MKKFLMTALCLMMTLWQASAQEVKGRATYQINQTRALWYNTTNAAGLAREDMLQWRDIALGYNLQSGSFKDSWDASSISGFKTGGDMLMDIAGFKVAASLQMERNNLNKCMYNASLYEVSWDMPFFVAMNSTETFDWKQTGTALSVSAATPLLLDDKLSAGLALKAQNHLATKTYDPHCGYTSFDVELAPSATFAINSENVVGLTLRYRLTPATSRLESVSGSPVGVVFLQGLGAFSPRVVGGKQEFGPIKYGASRYGGNVQYFHLGGSSQWLVEFSFDKGTTTVGDSERTMGSVDKFVTGLDIQGLFGATHSRKLNLSVNYNLNYWDDYLISGNALTTSQGNIIDVKMDYSIFTDTDRAAGFNFELGAGVDYTHLSLERNSPVGYLKKNSIIPYVFLGKNTRIGKEGELLARVDIGYKFAAGKPYYFEGKSDSDIVMNMFDDEDDYLSCCYFKAAANVAYTFRINNMLATYAKVNAGHLKPMGITGSRVIAGFSLGVLF